MNQQSNKEWKNAFSAAFPHTVPVLTGFLVLGLAYGVLMESKGYGPFWSLAMSAIAYCGSMQFVAITLLTTVFDPIQAFLLSIMVNARHLFYGISMLEKYKGMGKLRGFLIYTLCDETFSISCTAQVPEGISRQKFYFWVSFLNYFYWVFGSFCGGLLGGLLTFNTTGMDFALTALFVVLFIEQLKNKENRLSGILGLVCTVVGLVILGAERFIIPSMVLIILVLLGGRKKICS